MNNELEIQWLILDDNTISENDYIIWWDNELIIPENKNTLKYYYNQWTKREPSTSRSCWIFWSMGCVSDLTWYQFTEDNINEINKLAIDQYGLVIWEGMYMSSAVDCVRNWWNNNKKQQLISYRTTIWSEEFLEWLNKKHSFAVWYITSSEYYNDSQDNWVIDLDTFPTSWWWHLVRNNYLANINIDDNYYWTKDYNSYVNNKIVSLASDWVFFPSAYLFLYEEEMIDPILNNIDLEWAKAEYLLWTWSGTNPRENMSRQEVMQVINNLRKDLL